MNRKVWLEMKNDLVLIPKKIMKIFNGEDDIVLSDIEHMKEETIILRRMRDGVLNVVSRESGSDEERVVEVIAKNSFKVLRTFVVKK